MTVSSLEMSRRCRIMGRDEGRLWREAGRDRRVGGAEVGTGQGWHEAA